MNTKEPRTLACFPLDVRRSEFIFLIEGLMQPEHQTQKEVRLEMLGKLQPWSPIRSMLQEVNRFRQEADRLFERFFGEDSFDLGMPMLPPAESFIEDGKMVMRFDLPGVDAKDVDISIAGDTVTVRASRERRSHKGDGQSKRTEVSYGRFERSMTLPKGVKTDELKASYRNGVLELTAPVSPELAGRKIPVEIGTEQPQQLESKMAA